MEHVHAPKFGQITKQNKMREIEANHVRKLVILDITAGVLLAIGLTLVSLMLMATLKQ